MTIELKSYFEDVKGHGVLATTDSAGKPNVAIFSRPHVFDGDLVGFIMPERKTYQNLRSNPSAAYLFLEDPIGEGPRYKGNRLLLSKTGEEQDTERVKSLRKRTYDKEKAGRYLVTFKVEAVLPLVGAGE